MRTGYFSSTGRSYEPACGVFWGWPGVQPVHGDYDNDGVDDLAIFDQNTGSWFVRNMAGDIVAWQVYWGWAGVTGVSGDYDGDGQADLAIFEVRFKSKIKFWPKDFFAFRSYLLMICLIG